MSDLSDQWMTVEADIKDTAAYRVIRQITDHTWGSEIDLSDGDIVSICLDFRASGGSWESLMGGDMGSVVVLERCIDGLVGPKQMSSVSAGYLRRPGSVSRGP